MYQCDSEALAGSSIVRSMWEVCSDTSHNTPYGLGRMHSLIGKENWSYYVTGSEQRLERYFLNNEEFSVGISRKQHVIAFPVNPYNEQYIKPGNTLCMPSGERISFLSVQVDGETEEIYALLDIVSQREGQVTSAAEMITVPLWKCWLCDENGKELPRFSFDPYVSQVGLQGKVIYGISGMFRSKSIEVLHFINCALLSVVLCGIVGCLKKKYGLGMAACWYVVFAVSPFVVNFARNLYWVEYTGFIPMWIGLILCADSHKRWLCAAAAFISVFIKYLCGYEYITTIMMSSILFLLADLIEHFLKKRGKIRGDIINIVCIGTAELLGFISALAIHASIRGDSDVWAGLRNIYHEDVLRRTLGGLAKNFPERYAASLNAGILATLSRYFKFNQFFLPGIQGKWFFPMLFLALMCYLYWFAIDREKNCTMISLFILSLLSACSWFVLAKAHSYIHVALNLVLWPFGPIQMIVYVIGYTIVRLCRRYKRVKTIPSVKG